MAGLVLDTPAKHIYTGNGTTRVYPIPTYIQGDDWIRIEIDGVYIVDRRSYDIVNNSIIFVTAPGLNTQVSVQVATSVEALSQLGNSTNVDTVAGSIGNVNIVATDINNIDTVAGSITNVNTIATDISNVDTVAGSIGNVNTVANNITNVNTTATNINNVNNVGTDINNVNTVANDINSVKTTATNINNVNTTASSITNVNTVASNISNVNTVATNIVGINQIVNNLPEILLADDNATTATQQAIIATTKASEASASAVSASTSASTAITKANEASTSATNAANSAITATTKANEASASATSADASANQALTSRNQAETFAQQAQASASSVDANNIVHRTGNETIDGVKTFNLSPIVPTPTNGDNSTKVATTSFVNSEVGTANSPLVKTALNATGDAPIYACRAWVNFNGTGAVAIRASGNVSSITDNGTGYYGVNFTTAMPYVNYAVVPMINRTYNTNGGYGMTAMPATRNTTNVSLLCCFSNGDYYDQEYVGLSIHL